MNLKLISLQLEDRSTDILDRLADGSPKVASGIKIIMMIIICLQVQLVILCGPTSRPRGRL